MVEIFNKEDAEFLSGKIAEKLPQMLNKNYEINNDELATKFMFKEDQLKDISVKNTDFKDFTQFLKESAKLESYSLKVQESEAKNFKVPENVKNMSFDNNKFENIEIPVKNKLQDLSIKNNEAQCKMEGMENLKNASNITLASPNLENVNIYDTHKRNPEANITANIQEMAKDKFLEPALRQDNNFAQKTNFTEENSTITQYPISSKDALSFCDKVKKIEDKIITPNMTPEEKAVAICDYSRNKIEYPSNTARDGKFRREQHSVIDCVDSKKGVCESKAKLTSFMLNHQDIPARHINVYGNNKEKTDKEDLNKTFSDKKPNHAITAFQLNNQTYYTDPTVMPSKKERKKGKDGFLISNQEEITNGSDFKIMLPESEKKYGNAQPITDRSSLYAGTLSKQATRGFSPEVQQHIKKKMERDISSNKDKDQGDLFDSVIEKALKTNFKRLQKTANNKLVQAATEKTLDAAVTSHTGSPHLGKAAGKLGKEGLKQFGQMDLEGR